MRDLAQLHIRAMTEPGAAGERFIATGEFMWMKDIADTLRATLGSRGEKVSTRLLPDVVAKTMALFMPQLRGLTPELGRRNAVSSEKARRSLGFSPRPATTTLVDCANSLGERT